jgi:hypothetical protein
MVDPGGKVARHLMVARSSHTATQTDAIVDEERLVAELERLGVSYLSRRWQLDAALDSSQLPPADLIANLVRQPSSRVRAAVISLLLARPDHWRAVPVALARLGTSDGNTLRLFYTAAELLQQHHAPALRSQLGANWERLPSLFRDDLGIDDDASPESNLEALALAHRARTGQRLNWEGTYRQAADRLLRQWALEAKWSQ